MIDGRRQRRYSGPTKPFIEGPKPDALTAEQRRRRRQKLQGALTSNADRERERRRLEQEKRKSGQPHHGDGKGDGKGGKGGKGDGKGGKGDGKGGKGKKGSKNPYRKQATKLVKAELKPQLQEIKRYLDWIRTQQKQGIQGATTLGERTQADLADIFGSVQGFNTSQQANIANVLGQAQNTLGGSYDSAAGNINDAYAKAEEGANATLQRLGITPVGTQMQEDQAWLTGLNEQNRTAAAQSLAAQQGIFAQSGGLMGQALAGEQATQQGMAGVNTQNSIQDIRNQTRLQLDELMSAKKDLKGQKGAMINDAMQLLKQQAFEQMMEQAQLAALNKKAAEEMKLNWAELNSENQYRNAQLQQDANELALDKWIAQQDAWLEGKKLSLSGKESPRKARQEFMKSDISGWKDASKYASYMTKSYGLTPAQVQALQPIFSSIEANWGSYGDDGAAGGWGPITTAEGWAGNYKKAIEFVNKNPQLRNNPAVKELIKDYLNIGAGSF